MTPLAINDQEFALFQQLIYRIAGISLSPAKKSLVSGRLAKRLQLYQLQSYGDYYRLLASGTRQDELQMAVDLLTTNETYFFREPRHFDFLRAEILTRHTRGQSLRIWSAACSTGEEPYSIAMALHDALGEQPWEVLASDISQQVLARAQKGQYPLSRATLLPEGYLRKYCLKGVGAQEGNLMVQPQLRTRVQFAQINLNAELPRIGPFDVIFLRNVMIYFDHDTKRQVVARLSQVLRPGGYFIVGHSESLHGIASQLHAVQPSVYRKAGA